MMPCTQLVKENADKSDFINKKTRHRMGVNICRAYAWISTCVQNIQRILKTQFKNTNIKGIKTLDGYFTKGNKQMTKKHMSLTLCLSWINK